MITSVRRTLITGASRPIGLELVKQCLARGDRVIATSRNPARIPILADLRAKYGTLDLVALDPADAASVAEAVPMLESITSSVDLLLIAPGEPGPHERSGDRRDQQLESISATDLVEHYRRHAVAPLLLVRTLLPMLSAAGQSRVLFVGAEPAPASNGVGDAAYAVGASRAALGLLVKTLSPEAEQHGISVSSLLVRSDETVASGNAADDAMTRSVHALLENY